MNPVVIILVAGVCSIIFIVSGLPRGVSKEVCQDGRICMSHYEKKTNCTIYSNDLIIIL